MTVIDAAATTSDTTTCACPGDEPLAALVGADTRVPLVTGERVRYANLDYAASTPALRSVVEAVGDTLPLLSSVHRGAGYLSALSTDAYEQAREDVAAFVGARSDDVVIITRNTTDSLNLLASAVPTEGGVVHLDTEHHANLLPWRARGSEVVPARSTVAGTLEAIETALARRSVALLAISGASNVTGECPPLSELADLAHAHGARLAVDGAQLVPHRRVDLAATGIDYLAFSGHKTYAPFGAGVLVGRGDWLDAAAPHLAGGGAVQRVGLAETSWRSGAARHEGGTPNVIGAVALAAACRSLQALPAGAVRSHEDALARSLEQGLADVGGVRVLRQWQAAERVGVISFVVDGVPAALVAQYLSAEHGIGVRDGRFCAHPFVERLHPEGGVLRASIGLGTRRADVERLVDALHRLRRTGPRWIYPGPEHRPVPDPRPAGSRRPGGSDRPGGCAA